MDEAPGWTLEELVRRVELALDGAARVGAYPGAPNGRVRVVPDQRVIRWYTTTGLVDRPIGGRGRGARYGIRHLSQLVAIKRLQAAGSSLAEVQLRLTGADDDTLARLADLPAEVVAEPIGAFGLVGPIGAGGSVGSGASAGAVVREPREVAHRVSAPRRTARFWTAPPVQPSNESPEQARPDRVDTEAVPLAALKLSGGVLLLLPGAPGSPGVAGLSAADLSALAEAARPLLAALGERGLIPPGSGSPPAEESTDQHDQTRQPSRTEGAH